MKTYNLKPSLLILAILLVTSQLSYAVNWDKMLLKINDTYETGDYIKTEKYLIKLRKKATKKLGSENKYLVEYYILSARNKLAQGLLADFTSDIDKAITMSQKVFSETSEEYVDYLNRASALLIQNGDMLKAYQYAQKAQEQLDKLEASDHLKALTNLNLASVYSGMGFYAKAIAFMDENNDYFLGRAVKKESYVDESGKLKTKRLEQSDIDQRFDEYAQLLNLRANTYRLMGDFQKADTEFELAANWIDQNIGKSNIRYIENEFLHGDMLSENGANEKVTREYYEDALSKLKKDHSEAHYLALQIYESLLKNYLANGDNARFKNLKAEYERVIKKYFNKKSLVYIRLATIDFYNKLDRRNPKGIESACLGLLANYDRIPEFHKWRIELYQFAYRSSLQEKYFKNADGYLTKILDQKVALYGEDAPEYHLTKTEVANFYIDYTDKLGEAGDIYKNSFESIVKPQIKPGHISYVRTQNHLAKYFELTDNLEGAKQALEDALLATRAKYSDTDLNFGDELVKIADLQIKIGEYKGFKNETECS